MFVILTSILATDIFYKNKHTLFTNKSLRHVDFCQNLEVCGTLATIIQNNYFDGKFFFWFFSRYCIQPHCSFSCHHKNILQQHESYILLNLPYNNGCFISVENY